MTNTEQYHITINGLRVEIVRKGIKNLHLGVYPPNGRVRVAAPLGVSDGAIRLAVISRFGWIKRQRAKFEAQPRQSEREMVSSESHYFQGRRYRLNVVYHDGPAKVKIRNQNIIDLYVKSGSDTARRERAMLEWYRCLLKQQIPSLLEKWARIIGVQVSELRVKRMKTRWGSCNPKARRIWLNLELVKKPVTCLEYIIVHELVHLLERHHNDRFAGLMDQFMPQWRLYRAELNRGPLRHEQWGY
jgi:predicted metal-dependent hydrolase